MKKRRVLVVISALKLEILYINLMLNILMPMLNVQRQVPLCRRCGSKMFGQTYGSGYKIMW